MLLSDEMLGALLSKARCADRAIVPWSLLEMLCVQAKANLDSDRDRALVSANKIGELLTDPHNMHSAALSGETLRGLCQQAMGNPT